MWHQRPILRSFPLTSFPRIGRRAFDFPRLGLLPVPGFVVCDHAAAAPDSPEPAHAADYDCSATPPNHTLKTTARAPGSTGGVSELRALGFHRSVLAQSLYRKDAPCQFHCVEPQRIPCTKPPLFRQFPAAVDYMRVSAGFSFALTRYKVGVESAVVRLRARPTDAAF